MLFAPKGSWEGLRKRPVSVIRAQSSVFLVLVLWWTVTAVATSPNGPTQFAFAVLGDMPYGSDEEVEFPRLIDDINQDPGLSFVVHVGDFKSGGRTLCSEEVFQQAKRWFDRFRLPVIYTPGDNEWTDCHRRGLGGYDPIERLARLREIFFRQRGSLGQKSLPLARQSAEPAYRNFPENARWLFGNIVFATLHIVGSNNNLGRNSDNDAEHRERMDATLRWMREAFAVAKNTNMEALVLIFHANPALEKQHNENSGFHTFLIELEREVTAFNKPVLLIHGDTHTFRVDKPLRRREVGITVKNLTRLETFGSPRLDWVRVTVDRHGPRLFNIAPANFPRRVADPGAMP